MKLSQATRYILFLLLGLCLGYALGYNYHTGFSTQEEKQNTHAGNNRNVAKSVNAKQLKESSSNQSIPDYVIETLRYVKKYKQAPSDYVGGRIFQNREKKLPILNELGKKISYQEWDVHPKIKGQNRGAERLITSNHDKNYYTNNHYQSFILIPNE
ncbi:MAG: ribonuclease domain-containing protein [Chitinophagaceae bacterium]